MKHVVALLVLIATPAFASTELVAWDICSPGVREIVQAEIQKQIEIEKKKDPANKVTGGVGFTMQIDVTSLQPLRFRSVTQYSISVEMKPGSPVGGFGYMREVTADSLVNFLPMQPGGFPGQNLCDSVLVP